MRLGANVVAVIERDRAFFLQRQHRFDMDGHRLHRALNVFVGIFSAQRERVLQRHSVWDITVERIMRAGLIRQNIGNHSAFYDFRKDIGAIANQTDRKRLSIFARCFNQLERFIDRPRDLVAVTALQSLLDPRRIDVNTDKNGAVHGRGKRLRAAHSTEPAADDEFTREISIEMFLPRRAKGFECALHNSLAADVNPGTGRHLSIHR